jgi:hypothetical protein
VTQQEFGSGLPSGSGLANGSGLPSAAPEEELRGGGWSRRLIATVGVVAAALVASFVVVIAHNPDRVIAGHARLLNPPAVVVPAQLPVGADALGPGTWTALGATHLTGQVLRLTASVELVNQAGRALRVLYPLSVTGPGVGSRIHVQQAVIAVDRGSGDDLMPRPLTRIRAGTRVELWVELRLDCRGHPGPLRLIRYLTVSIGLDGAAGPASFPFASLFDVSDGTMIPGC